LQQLDLGKPGFAPLERFATDEESIEAAVLALMEFQGRGVAEKHATKRVSFVI